ncbi:chorismate mutase [Streptomyces sp. H27-C3]|uniref:chorismate mutase n=1 Tax=Streptomyces sp. H27-C3 TaxID=3046305 RepID=UPI0024BB6AB2|nr:chorismate mutase [Streptomyces sp. H27-C3]MDJ0466672.1 chorismate mutase [Streptomyces sp. H27-C3]
MLCRVPNSSGSTGPATYQAQAQPRTPLAAPAQPVLQRLVELAAARVLLADQVAAAKYGTDSPIDDPSREQQVLDAMAQEARGLELDPAEATTVFKDQIEANKLVQRQLFRAWDRGTARPPAYRPTLAEIRPLIDSVNHRLLKELSATDAVRNTARCAVRLATAEQTVARQLQLSPLHETGLLRALPSVCRAR